VPYISPSNAKHSAYSSVDDADELAATWRAAGAEVHMPEDTEWSQREGALVDPDGTFSGLARPFIDRVSETPALRVALITIRVAIQGRNELHLWRSLGPPASRPERRSRVRDPLDRGIRARVRPGLLPYPCLPFFPRNVPSPR